MSQPASNPDLAQLTQSVAVLAEALARSERRYAQLARVLRWGTLALVTVVSAVGFTAAGRFAPAYAQGAAAPEAAQALERIADNLVPIGMLGQALNQASPVIQQALMNNPDVQAQVRDYLKAKGLPDTPENMMANATPAVIEAGLTTLANTVVLMHRIRGDSNAFRDLIGDPAAAIGGVAQELKVMNAALVAVPAMAMQMDLMNRNISAMTYSMGSTMGRMGSWMP